MKGTEQANGIIMDSSQENSVILMSLEYFKVTLSLSLFPPNSLNCICTTVL
jgi:hypothetical protein